MAAFSTHSSGRRARPGVNPFISALPVACCPAILPGAWIQLRDTLSISWGAGRTRDRGFLYLLPFSENGPLFRQFPFAKIQPVFLPGQAGSIKHRPPFSSSVTPAGITGITHYTLQAKSCAKRPPWHPGPFHSLCVVPCKLNYKRNSDYPKRKWTKMWCYQGGR